ncbi:hypothetical protein EVAR_13031_1 [Eumeta japonica]|uniref:Uncharacterized protein n=1 Tax=Eumeta variegata TaxID=151549 RepID=A0A4C1VHZ6_EUMVA|nr:hypothetical protein EVAR_13031_1 [Eumeta japonica]
MISQCRARGRNGSYVRCGDRGSNADRTRFELKRKPFVSDNGKAPIGGRTAAGALTINNILSERIHFTAGHARWRRARITGRDIAISRGVPKSREVRDHSTAEPLF